MEIDRSAPLSAKRDTVIAAPTDLVWTVLTTIERWPEWQPAVSMAHQSGDLAAGTKFRWKAKGMRIVSTIQALEHGRRIGWTGKAVGMNAIHIWTLEPEDLVTRVTTEESLSGWVPRLIGLFDPAFLDKSLDASLNDLKAHVETMMAGKSQS